LKASQTFALVFLFLVGFLSFAFSYFGLMSVAFSFFNGPRTTGELIAAGIFSLVLLASFPMFLLYLRRPILAVRLQWLGVILSLSAEWWTQLQGDRTSETKPGALIALARTVSSPESGYFFSLALALLLTVMFFLKGVTGKASDDLSSDNLTDDDTIRRGD
jgi:hypothetical protein